MAEEQHRPLAPASVRPSSDNEEAALYQKKIREKKCIKCCGCVAALLLIQITVVIILIFTVFKIKDPIITMNDVKVDKLDLINGTNPPTPRPGSNMTLTADVSVKNPNVASFKYSNTTTAIYYRGTMIGEARGPPGHSKARRTTRMNITVDVIVDRLISDPNIRSDMQSGILTMGSFTRVGGRVKILKIIKKHIIVKMNCTMSINTTSRSIQEIKCKKKVNL